MKRLAAMWSLLLALVLAAAPFQALAQGDGEEDEREWAEFVSFDNMLTALYPAEWFVAGTAEAPGFAFATSQEVLDQIVLEENTTPFEPGDVAMQVFLLPAEIFSMLGMEFTEETTLEELTTMIGEQFLTGDSAETGDTTATPEPSYEVGEAEVVEFGEDEIEVGIALVSMEAQSMEGLMLIRVVAPGVIAFAAGMAYEGEFDEDVQALFTEAVASIEYSGTGDDLMDLLMGGANAG